MVLLSLSLQADVIPTQHQDVPLNTILQCEGGEAIALSGVVHSQFTQSVDAKGGLHFNFVFKYGDLLAVGLTSGIRYTVSGTSKGSLYFSGPLPIEFTYHVYNLKLIGPGSYSNFLISEFTHLTINANGEVTVQIANSTLECK